ncbi:zf-HC2 domain-containing protein [Aquabacterium sp. A7-Y]|uniref:zf-HC2 domain-containing protein n=1 Tax=Aquabacterium sp. A7-Y TaxID=1349605 RepID=UPI00223D5149|nr:zf-HC2 domain-containing protein [Aquabacterium sp. A7-Y]MCW7538810.1 zf-HC2 domain-containing protein [Aquabacterium sp. A7-Y]
MKLKHYPLRRTCREVARLILQKQDRALPWREALALRLHLRICQACPRFEKQVRLMQRGMEQWRAYREEEGEPKA